MLGKRYRNDGKPAVFLQAPQREMKRRIDEKVRKGIYTFEKVLVVFAIAMISNRYHPKIGMDSISRLLFVKNAAWSKQILE